MEDLYQFVIAARDKLIADFEAQFNKAHGWDAGLGADNSWGNTERKALHDLWEPLDTWEYDAVLYDSFPQWSVLLAMEANNDADEFYELFKTFYLLISDHFLYIYFIFKEK